MSLKKIIKTSLAFFAIILSGLIFSLHFFRLELRSSKMVVGEQECLGIWYWLYQLGCWRCQDWLCNPSSCPWSQPIHHWYLKVIKRIIAKLINTFFAENVGSRAKELPPRGFFLMAMPYKLEGGSGAPTRLVALLGATRDELGGILNSGNVVSASISIFAAIIFSMLFHWLNHNIKWAKQNAIENVKDVPINKTSEEKKKNRVYEYF